MAEEKKERKINFHRFQLIIQFIVLLVAFGLSLYFYSSKPDISCERNSSLKYWPVVLNEWNENDNLRTIKRVFDRLGHSQVNGSVGSWDVLWSIEFPFDTFPEKLVSFQPHQRINHIPGMTFLTNKKYLSVSTHSKYIPVSFEFPRLKNEFLYYSKMDLDKKFVVKNFDNRGNNAIDTLLKCFLRFCARL